MPQPTLSSQLCHTLADWLCYIEQRHPIDNIELGLSRVAAVATKAQLQQLPGRTILIGGTNGKGTTARTLEQLLLAQSFSVGVYSSPHLLRFNERLRVNAQDLPDEQWLAGFAAVEALRGDTELTYFEFTTLVAFWLLRQAAPDFCLIEVGLGGRLDATNIIEPELSIITTVDLDHQDWLGNDRETIGREKAGIMRPGKLVIVGDPQPPLSVLEHAKLLGSTVVAVGQQYHYQLEQAQWHWHWQFDQLPGASLPDSAQQYRNLPLAQIPVQNIATSLAALAALQLLPTPNQLQQCLATLNLPGRMQWLGRKPAILVDVAHNPQSTAYLASQLTIVAPKYRRVLALVGMLKDKDLKQSLQPLTSLIDQWHLVTLHTGRGASATQLSAALPASVSCLKHEQLAPAFNQLRAELADDELLVIFGSFVTVSEVMAITMKEAE
ncbi:bifunctional tetrahydrofolate synthase/dihydrofolate synthase [Arsukibacterium sp.]|uniref:bifunctional tetrahydrofolate synthase/dihydrofolate synthase n=1 Tax=Arsukibacterium sp. TaxID=1977258 RepID=UPI002FD9984C